MINKIFNRELFLYIITGFFTTCLNFLLFYYFNIMGLKYYISNLITLIVVKIVAYICNKKIVFKRKCKNLNELLKEFFSFAFWRGITFFVDYFGLILLVELFSIDKNFSKIFVTLLVIIINYVTSKKYIFMK